MKYCRYKAICTGVCLLLLLQGCAKKPLANFTAIPTQGEAPLTVAFTDLSYPGSKAIDTWLWDFGDGESSTQVTPLHTYTETGDYTVSLTVKTSIGAHTLQRENYIKVIASEPEGEGEGSSEGEEEGQLEGENEGEGEGSSVEGEGETEGESEGNSVEGEGEGQIEGENEGEGEGAEETGLALQRTFPSGTTVAPGALLPVQVTLTYSGSMSPSAFGLTETLPEGWTFAQVTAQDEPAPVAGAESGAEGVIEFLWIEVPQFPYRLSYTLRAPTQKNDAKTALEGQGVYRLEGDELRSEIVADEIFVSP